jgi:hypothetical protein
LFALFQAYWNFQADDNLRVVDVVSSLVTVSICHALAPEIKLKKLLAIRIEGFGVFGRFSIYTPFCSKDKFIADLTHQDVVHGWKIW